MSSSAPAFVSIAVQKIRSPPDEIPVNETLAIYNDFLKSIVVDFELSSSYAANHNIIVCDVYRRKMGEEGRGERVITSQFNASLNNSERVPIPAIQKSDRDGMRQFSLLDGEPPKDEASVYTIVPKTVFGRQFDNCSFEIEYDPNAKK